MEIKKSPKADLENKRGLFLEIGLAVSLLVVILAFNWSQKEKVYVKMDDTFVVEEVETIINTTQEQKPPTPVKQTISVVSDVLNIVKNETKITTSLSFEDFDFDAAVDVAPVAQKPVEEEIEEEQIFLAAEFMPEFQGGDLNKFREWVQKKLVYPVIAAENGIQGTVVIAFVIERDGTLTNIEVIATPDSSLAEEAVRVLKTSPKWTPGKQRNKPVRVKYTLPIVYKMQN